MPVHLLTREAMALYLSHLRGPDSVIVVNATNVFVNLAPVVVALAETYGLEATLIRSTVRTALFQPSVIILLTRRDSLDAPDRRKGAYQVRPVMAKLTGTVP